MIKEERLRREGKKKQKEEEKIRCAMTSVVVVESASKGKLLLRLSEKSLAGQCLSKQGY